MRRLFAVAILFGLMLAIVAPAAAKHGSNHKPSPTPVATASPTLPPATPEPTPTPEPVTPSPEPATAEPSEQPSPEPTSYPILYADEYWVLLARWPSGYAPNPCDAIWPPAELCHAIWLPYWFYPDASWGYCPWYADPTVPTGWSIVECDPWADLGY